MMMRKWYKRLLDDVHIVKHEEAQCLLKYQE